MPPIYDDYIDETGFGEDMTLFSDESTILEEVSIEYDNKVPIYDDYIVESGFGRVSTLGSNDPTILEDVESYCD